MAESQTPKPHDSAHSLTPPKTTSPGHWALNPDNGKRVKLYESPVKAQAEASSDDAQGVSQVPNFDFDLIATPLTATQASGEAMVSSFAPAPADAYDSASARLLADIETENLADRMHTEAQEALRDMTADGLQQDATLLESAMLQSPDKPAGYTSVVTIADTEEVKFDTDMDTQEDTASLHEPQPESQQTAEAGSQVADAPIVTVDEHTIHVETTTMAESSPARRRRTPSPAAADEAIVTNDQPMRPIEPAESNKAEAAAVIESSPAELKESQESVKEGMQEPATSPEAAADEESPAKRRKITRTAVKASKESTSQPKKKTRQAVKAQPAAAIQQVEEVAEHQAEEGPSRKTTRSKAPTKGKAASKTRKPAERSDSSASTTLRRSTRVRDKS